jgi:hypothetical protein
MYVSAVLAAASYVDTTYLPGDQTVPLVRRLPPEALVEAGRCAGLLARENPCPRPATRSVDERRRENESA